MERLSVSYREPFLITSVEVYVSKWQGHGMGICMHFGMWEDTSHCIAARQQQDGGSRKFFGSHCSL